MCTYLIIQWKLLYLLDVEQPKKQSCIKVFRLTFLIVLFGLLYIIRNSEVFKDMVLKKHLNISYTQMHSLHQKNDVELMGRKR